MKRVNKGEKYWSIDKYGSIYECLECGSVLNDYHYESLIYFHTEEEARTMRDKLRAVLNGAEIDEINYVHEVRKDAYIGGWKDGQEDLLKRMPTEKDLYEVMPETDAYDELASGERIGWRACYKWIKSKMVK